MENSNDRYHQSFFRFEDLRLYHKSIEYNNWVQNNVSYFSEDVKLTLVVPFVRASQAIIMGIAEGSSRHRLNFAYFLNLSKTSIRECVVYTSIAKELGYFTQEQEEESRKHLMEMTKMTGALIVSLSRTDEERANYHANLKHKGDIEFED